MKEPPRHIVAAGALVSNAEGQVLLIDSPWRGWEFPGGQVEEGEDIVSGLRREIFEETGVEADIGSMVGLYSNLSKNVVITTFLAQYRSGDLTTSAESLRVQWCERDRAVAKVSHPAVRCRLQDLLDFRGEQVYRAYTIEPYRLLTKHRSRYP